MVEIEGDEIPTKTEILVKFLFFIAITAVLFCT